jgi:UDP-2,3-diacylglucosamine hydrolase
MILTNPKKIFFTSDHHFGVPNRAQSLERELKFVQWLEHNAPEMEALYIMGDLFDFWFEYKTVIPKGYSLLLGALAKLRQQGIPVHYFRGNHDMWAFSYLSRTGDTRTAWQEVFSGPWRWTWPGRLWV